MEQQEQSGLSDDELAYLAGSMFGAGSDTVSIRSFLCDDFCDSFLTQTGGVLGFLTMASACYPEAQRRVQAQLDAVVGRDRREQIWQSALLDRTLTEYPVPTFADQDKLPEVWAYIEELYRWRPVVPSGAD